MVNDETMYQRADTLRALIESKRQLQAELDEVKKQLAKEEELLSAEMVERELQNFKRKGILFYLQAEYYPSIPADDGTQKLFFKSLRKEGFGDIVKETVHPQTLKAFVKEQMQRNDDELPEWMDGLVNVYIKNGVRTRKS